MQARSVNFSCTTNNHNI